MSKSKTERVSLSLDPAVVSQARKEASLRGFARSFSAFVEVVLREALGMNLSTGEKGKGR